MDGQLVLKDTDVRISLTMIRNNGEEDYYFDKASPKEKYAGFNADQVEHVFNSVVTVGFLNTQRWRPEDVLDAQIARTEALLLRYLGST